MNIFDYMMPVADPNVRPGKFYGLVIGVVTNNQHRDRPGCVKVRYPWLSETDESEWARVATLMAGPNRGSFFLPEVNDEVLIAFEHGDTRRPFVIGALWNGQDTPPYRNDDGKNDLRALRSRSGHELIFNDREDHERVEIRTQSGHHILLDDTQKEAKIVIQDNTGKNTIEIDTAKNTISIISKSDPRNSTLRLNAPKIEIEADTSMLIKAGGPLTIKGALVDINPPGA